MIGLIIVVSLILILIDRLVNHDLFSPTTMFTLLWGSICTLASLSLFGYTGYSDRAVGLVLCGIVAFSCGSLLSGGRISNKRKASYITSNLHLNMTFLRIILALTVAGSLLSLYYSLIAYSGGASLSEVRSGLLGYSDDQIISNPLIEVFVNYFVVPARTALLPIAFVLLMRREHLKFCAVTFLCVIAGIVSSGGRIVILYAIIMGFASMKYYKTNVLAKMRKRIIGVALLGIAVIVVLTLARGSDLWLSAYAYFSIPIGLLDHYIEVIDSSGYQSYGAAFFYPILYVANAFASCVGESSDFLVNLVYYVGLPQNAWVGGLIPGKSYNAFCSLFYFFYMDYRELGIIVLSLVYGLVVGAVYKRAVINKNQNCFIWYLLALYSIFGSFIIWQLGSTKFFVAVLILLIAQITADKATEQLPECSTKREND